MIEFKCNNNFLNKSFTDLFKQKNFIEINSLKIPNNIIQIEDSTDKITIAFNSFKKQFMKPTTFSVIFNDLRKEIVKIKYEFNSLFYFPFLREIVNGEISIHLSDIQNKILLQLVLNENEVNKEELYKFIWPNDKEISINKLDTHLTNLKSLILDKLKFEFKIRSLDKTLKLIIN